MHRPEALLVAGLGAIHDQDFPSHRRSEAFLYAARSTRMPSLKPLVVACVAGRTRDLRPARSKPGGALAGDGIMPELGFLVKCGFGRLL